MNPRYFLRLKQTVRVSRRPFFAAALLAGAVVVFSFGDSRPALSSPAVYDALAPHWSHINVLDFGRGLKWIPSPTSQAAGYAWYAQHTDVMETGMDTLSSTYANTPSAYIKSLNPTIKTFGYEFDLSICQHMVCKNNQPVNSAQSNLPEDQYLHFSQDTQLKFVALDGVTIVATITIPGCPTGSVTAACRVQTYNWEDYRWLPNLKSLAWRQWFADRLLVEMEHDTNGAANPVDGLFLDEHGPGFSIPFAIGYKTIILSGGGIREYGGLVPQDYRFGTYNALDTQYNADVVTWLTYLQSRLGPAGKFIHINAAEYFMDPLVVSQTLASKGAMIEHLHAADNFPGGGTQYQQFINTVNQVTAAGGTVDLAGTPCSYGPAGYTPGNYQTAKERFLMWNLASYYMVKETGTDPGRAYFNPNLCILFDSSTPLSFQADWLAAFQENVGQPIDQAAVLQHGPLGCGSQEYKIFARHYDHALVLVRPRDDRNCTNYNDQTAVQVPLPSTMVMLKPNGTYSAPLNTALLRNSEAIILFDVADTTPPAAVTNLQGR